MKVRSEKALLLLATAVLCPVVGATLRAKPERPRTAATILSEAKKASGGAAWDRAGEIVIQRQIELEGLTGTSTYAEDLIRGRNVSRYQFGSAAYSRGASGNTGKQTWSQDDNGDVQLAPPDITDSYLAKHGYWRANFDGASAELLPSVREPTAIFDCVRIQPPSGEPFVLWINRASHLITRLQLGSASMTYSNYRNVDGILVPFTQITKRSPSGQIRISNAIDVQVLSSVKDEDFQIPFQKDYSFTASGPASVPFTGAEYGVITVQATVNGQGPFPFVFDSGSANVISSALAQKLGLTVQAQGKASAFGGDIQIASAHIQSLQIGSLKLNDQNVHIVESSPYMPSVPLGLLGYEFLRRFAIEINYGNGRLTFYDGPTYRYGGDGTRLPLLVSGGLFEIDGAIDQIPARLQLDSGSEQSLVLFNGFVRQHKLIQYYGAKLAGVTGYGFGGLTKAWLTRIGSLRLGALEVHSPVTDLSIDNAGVAATQTVAGNIGAGILRRFTVTFDCIHQQIFLDPNGRFSEPETFDRSGMVLEEEAGGLKVLGVLDGSPAAEVGIGPGDFVTQINDRPIAPGEYRVAFKRVPGTLVSLTIQHEGQIRHTDVRLRDLL